MAQVIRRTPITETKDEHRFFTANLLEVAVGNSCLRSFDI